MKNLISFIIFIFIAIESFAQVNPQSKSVRGYVKKDGSYVQQHQRTIENNTNRDNYTTKPNSNPYNGKKGYKQPDNKSTYNNNIKNRKY